MLAAGARVDECGKIVREVVGVATEADAEQPTISVDGKRVMGGSLGNDVHGFLSSARSKR